MMKLRDELKFVERNLTRDDKKFDMSLAREAEKLQREAEKLELKVDKAEGQEKDRLRNQASSLMRQANQLWKEYHAGYAGDQEPVLEEGMLPPGVIKREEN